jgi:hypothetical protein
MRRSDTGPQLRPDDATCRVSCSHNLGLHASGETKQPPERCTTSRALLIQLKASELYFQLGLRGPLIRSSGSCPRSPRAREAWSTCRRRFHQESHVNDARRHPPSACSPSRKKTTPAFDFTSARHAGDRPTPMAARLRLLLLGGGYGALSQSAASRSAPRGSSASPPAYRSMKCRYERGGLTGRTVPPAFLSRPPRAVHALHHAAVRRRRRRDPAHPPRVRGSQAQLPQHPLRPQGHAQDEPARFPLSFSFALRGEVSSSFTPVPLAGCSRHLREQERQAGRPASLRLRLRLHAVPLLGAPAVPHLRSRQEAFGG